MKTPEIIPYNPELKEVARKLRTNMTFSEVILWSQLKQKKMLGYDFDRQRPIDNYIVDFYCKELKLAIEIDGASHEFEDVWMRDMQRQERLEALGVRVLRFTDDQVKRDIEGVMLSIQLWIEENG